VFVSVGRLLLLVVLLLYCICQRRICFTHRFAAQRVCHAVRIWNYALGSMPRSTVVTCLFGRSSSCHGMLESVHCLTPTSKDGLERFWARTKGVLCRHVIRVRARLGRMQTMQLFPLFRDRHGFSSRAYCGSETRSGVKSPF
jgi:hypothetical protein